MDAWPRELAEQVSSAAVLGYLNFSDGRPDPRWQKAFAHAYAILAEQPVEEPWRALSRWLSSECARLEAEGSAAFNETSQVRAVLRVGLDQLPFAYREHHADLLAHLPDRLMFAPFFLVRACEAVLRQGGPWNEEQRLCQGALAELNDFVGHRPIAILETRAQTEYYPHEKCRPIPLYLRDVGVSDGPYAPLLNEALKVLRETNNDLFQEAFFDLDLLDELAMDPRAYDHQHPVNRRPNYLFGEWDPHHIDAKGRYRRFVLRQVTVDALRSWPSSDTHEQPDLERLREAGTVLAGIILMASGICGAGPGTFDSTSNLVALVPRIARYRDQFYKEALERLEGAHGDRLRAEAHRFRQPYASIRQHLNQALAQQRATQLQERRLAILFAEMGYPEASRTHIAKIDIPAVRFHAKLHILQTTCRQEVAAGRFAQAWQRLPEIEALLQRGIDCGALPDPWNLLGFQGFFPLFFAREDSVRDTRHEELLTLIERQLDLYAQILTSVILQDDPSLATDCQAAMERFVTWWDRFAAHEISDLPRVHGGERYQAAVHVANALKLWRDRPADQNEIDFWRQQRQGFQSPSAFAPVIEALMRNRARRSALALLLTWLSESDSIPLHQGEVSYHELFEHWLRTGLNLPSQERQATLGSLQRFFELLEANADTLWAAPRLSLSNQVELPSPEEVSEESYTEPSLYDAAYEEMTYRDSTDDGEDSALAGGMAPQARDVFPLEEQANSLQQHLDFLTTLARAWQQVIRVAQSEESPDAISRWLDEARQLQSGLQQFLQRLFELRIPEPIGQYETVIEFDRRRWLKESLIEKAVVTTVEMGQAVRGLAALLGEGEQAASPQQGWESMAVRLEDAIARGDAGQVRQQLITMLPSFRKEPMLFIPLSSGGHPEQILRARTAQAFLRRLLERLPRLGLLRESFHLVKLAWTMEQSTTLEGRKISEFDQLFRVALRAVIEVLLESAEVWESQPSEKTEQTLTDILRRVADAFLTLWISHSQTLRLSALEAVGEEESKSLHAFVSKYGSELFTVQFLSLANIRGILHRGVDSYLDTLIEEADPAKPMRLLDDLESEGIYRREVRFFLETVLQTLVEHYEEYRDYNATTTQSDYGENLYQLMEFLKLKVQYERYAWRMKPMLLAHEVLCRRAKHRYADRWRESVRSFTEQLADQLLSDLAQLEAKTGIRLRTVRDRLEERFVQPLLLDRLCALIEPAMRSSSRNPPEQANAFAELQEQLIPFTQPATGNGLDAPAWLRRLEGEVDRVHDALNEPEDEERIPLHPLTFDELQRQLAEWERPLA